LEIKLEDGEEIQITAAAYADDLILFTEDHADLRNLLDILGAFRQYAKMKANADKCVSISQQRFVGQIEESGD
jgi:predicted nuclease of predicted toxin-antitoxin system